MLSQTTVAVQPAANMNEYLNSSSFSRYDVRVIKKFSLLLNKESPEIHNDIVTALGEIAPTKKTVRKWVKMILKGRTQYQD